MTPSDADHAAIARAIVDANVYMTLGTADAEGRPWVSPVFFAASGYRDYYWISSPDARHSRNLAGRESLLTLPAPVVRTTLNIPLNEKVTGLPRVGVPYFFLKQTYDTRSGDRLAAVRAVIEQVERDRDPWQLFDATGGFDTSLRRNEDLELGYPLPGIADNYLPCIAKLRGDIEGMMDHFTRAAKRSAGIARLDAPT